MGRLWNPGWIDRYADLRGRAGDDDSGREPPPVLVWRAVRLARREGLFAGSPDRAEPDRHMPLSA